MASTATTTTGHCLPLLDYLGRMARVRSEEALEPHGLRPRHLVALAVLAESGPAPQQELAVALRLDPSNLVGLLNQLDDRGFVTRHRSPADRRRHIVELTREGERTLAAIHRTLRAAEDELLGGLEEDDRAKLGELLRRLVGDVNPCTVETVGIEPTSADA
jgi:MarR family transcriptional regulator, lower aerobic nicotinate degradation pathway regulator